MSSGGYDSWRSALQAVKARAKAVRATNLQTTLQQVYFDRFLCRVFADGESSNWLLKGGMGMLARVPEARSTKDVDLSAPSAASLDEAVQSLAERVGLNLDDHLHFELVRVQETGRGTNQPDTETRKATFACLDERGHRVAEVLVDIAVEHEPFGTVEVVTPANRLSLPRALTTFQYRLWPTADQIADKVCATMTTYGQRPSSRIKDLVDLSLIASTQTVNLTELRGALELKRTLARISPFTEFSPPPHWRDQYATISTTAPAAVPDFDVATQLVAGLVRPALTVQTTGEQWWVPGLGWGHSPGELRDQQHPTDSVWVRNHARADVPVKGHWRSPRSR